MGWLIASIFCGVEVLMGIGLTISAGKKNLEGAIVGILTTLVFAFLSYYFMKRFKKYKMRKEGSEEEHNHQDKNKNFKFRRLKGAIVVLFVFVIMISIFQGINTDKKENVEDSVEAIKKGILIDVAEFAKISPEQLVEIMGEPDRIDEVNYTNPKEEVYTMTSYSYNNGDYEFQIIDGKVVEFIIYGSEDTVMPYSNKSSVFSVFGIEPSDIMVETADTGVALRYESVTDQIEELWIPMLNTEEKTIEIAKIVYDKIYFGNLPRMATTISEQSELQIRCQRGIESLLKSPSTAKFPNINNWYIGKDREKIIVQSYVDAQNSFGAELRSEFQVTFSPSGDTVTSLIFEGIEYIK